MRLATILILLLLSVPAEAIVIQPMLPQMTEWTTFTCTRVDDDTFSVEDSPENYLRLTNGRPVRYADTPGQWNYAIVVDYDGTGGGGAVDVDIAGAPMTIDHDAYCQSGLWGQVYSLYFSLPGAFANAADPTLLLNDLLMYYSWQFNTAYLVYFAINPQEIDSGATQPRINVEIDDAAVSTSNTNAGLELVAADTRVATTTDINLANYQALFGSTIEVTVDDNLDNGDAMNLSVVMIFVLEGKPGGL